MSLRKKIFLSQLVIFVVLMVLLIPFVENTVRGILHRSLKETAIDVINSIKQAPDQPELIRLLKKEEDAVFFRMSLLNEKGEMLYDTHLPKRIGEEYAPFSPSTHPEVVDALKSGEGYYEGYSQIFEEKFAYVAIKFRSHNTTYLLRTAFPFTQVQELSQNFEVGILILCALLLLFFSLLTWFIFNRLTRPIHRIIDSIRTYQQGNQESIPEIHLDRTIAENDDFNQLVKTLNSLSARIRSQIKNILEEKNEKEAILESLGEGVIAVDEEMRVRYVNFIGSKMLAVPKRYLLGKSLSTQKESPLIHACQTLLQASQERQAILTDSISLGEDRKLYLDLIAAPKSGGQGAIIVLQDKSSQYKVLEMGKDFVANASHELRTPITIIRGFAETLHDLPELPRDMLIDITDKIVRSCQRMDNLVKNLLTLADIENLPEARFQQCDLLSLIENCVHMLLTKYPDAIVTIEKEQEGIQVAAAPDLIELAILNLLDNAAKYSTPPAHITIRLSATVEEAHISISDQGMGIPEADLEHIFERFYTVNKAHSRRLGGAGLGLSIVKTIIEKHDGTISATSLLGKGTTFTITLSTHRTHHSF
jgi:two-component system phosphate regulon sensor histidine kinase PhoR